MPRRRDGGSAACRRPGTAAGLSRPSGPHMHRHDCTPPGMCRQPVHSYLYRAFQRSADAANGCAGVPSRIRLTRPRDPFISHRGGLEVNQGKLLGTPYIGVDVATAYICCVLSTAPCEQLSVPETCSERLFPQRRNIEHPAGKAPFIVIPAENPHDPAPGDHRLGESHHHAFRARPQVR